MSTQTLPPIPAHMKADKYWGSMLIIFTQSPKLSRYLVPEYVNFKSGHVAATKLKKEAGPWSKSEKFMLALALHCFSERNKVNLGDMDYLDPNNRRIAFDALIWRYGRGIS